MASDRVFLDSGFVIALVMRGDQHHAETQSIWRRITSERRLMVTTTFVLDEVVTFLNSRSEHQLAVETGDQLLTSAAIELLDVNLPLLLEGWDYFVSHTDKNYSLTDCVSFVTMIKQRLSNALTFDHHFIQAGFAQVQ
jgi:predicted nucleic acid-binding protein